MCSVLCSSHRDYRYGQWRCSSRKATAPTIFIIPVTRAQYWAHAWKGKIRNKLGQVYFNIQGVKAESGKCLSSKLGRNQCLYWNKQYISKKPLISALILDPETRRGFIMRMWPCHRRQRVKNPFRGHKIQQNMLFAASRRGTFLMMPRPLLRCQIKAEIQGFLLMYRLFLY
jgi:hypothetical protein